MSAAADPATVPVPTQLSARMYDAEIALLTEHKRKLMELMRLRKEVAELGRGYKQLSGHESKMLVIKQEVSMAYGVTVADIEGRKRTYEMALPRQVVCYVAKAVGGLALREIAEAIGGKKHGTVLHSVKIVAGFMQSEKPAFRAKVNAVMDACKKRLEAVA